MFNGIHEFGTALWVWRWPLLLVCLQAPERYSMRGHWLWAWDGTGQSRPPSERLSATSWLAAKSLPSFWPQHLKSIWRCAAVWANAVHVMFQMRKNKEYTVNWLDWSFIGSSFVIFLLMCHITSVILQLQWHPGAFFTISSSNGSLPFSHWDLKVALMIFFWSRLSWWPSQVLQP